MLTAVNTAIVRIGRRRRTPAGV